MPRSDPPTAADRALAIERAARWAGVVAGALLTIVYVATAATSVTFWDAGEFLAAFHTWGIAHPPGTPLFVLLGRVATRAAPFAGPVLPGSLLSAASTVVAGVLTARLATRWTGGARAGVAAALCAGATSSVWLNATETEVYASSLCLAMLALAVADRMARGATRRDRGTPMLAYLFGLATPLHLSAIVAAPAIGLLAASDGRDAIQRRWLVLLAGLAIIAAGAGSVAPTAIVVGTLVVAAATVVPGGRADRSLAIRSVLAVALGVSAVLVLRLRALHDPILDQGHATTWHALADVVARRQYAVAPLWPREAPWWLQIANVGQWADWQFGLGLNANVEPSGSRLTATLAYVLLGIVGARELRAREPRAWRATAVLLAAGTLGVAAFLNLKAGPSLGWGVLPNDAPHEARERDYFFVLGFWTWGVWAGIGAATAAEWCAARLGGAAGSRRRFALRGVGVAIAALPVALNWRAVTRRHMPEAALPRALAAALLASAPPHAVLLLLGDNDTYPLWYLQLAEGMRTDVVPVTIPLLGAPWYRAELARRHALLPANAAARWTGVPATLAAIASAARRDGRPLATSAAVSDATRGEIGGAWSLRGLAWVRIADATAASTVDTIATERIVRGIDPRVYAPVRTGGDGVAEWAQTLLRCPRVAMARVRRDPAASLDAICN